MLFDSWYTDTVDIYRVQNVSKGNVTSQERVIVNQKPLLCRVYSKQHSGPTMQKGAAKTASTEKMACPVGTDVKTGDELRIIRGGALGKLNKPERYFAGQPLAYYDPVGGSLSGLEHTAVAISKDEVIR